jgi:hypothetical protein
LGGGDGGSGGGGVGGGYCTPLVANSASSSAGVTMFEASRFGRHLENKEMGLNPHHEDDIVVCY